MKNLIKQHLVLKVKTKEMWGEMRIKINSNNSKSNHICKVFGIPLIFHFMRT